MKSLPSFFRKKPEDVLVIHGSGETIEEKKKISSAEWFYYGSIVLLIGSLLLGYLSTGSLITEQEFAWRDWYRLLNEKKSVQANLESLEQLSSRLDTIREEQLVIERAVPFEPWHEQVMGFIEYEVEQIKKKTYLEMPETISWRPVSPTDVSNDELADLYITHYAVSLTGSYEGIFQFITSLRESLRMMDLRSMSNFRQDELGNVSADLVFWTYSLSLL